MLVVEDWLSTTKEEFAKCVGCKERPACRNSQCELGTREREELTEVFPPDTVADARLGLRLARQYPKAKKRPRWWEWETLQLVRTTSDELRRFEENKARSTPPPPTT